MREVLNFRVQMADGRGQMSEFGIRNAEGGKKRGSGDWKCEVGPVFVPERRDYAAASMRKSEKNEVEKVRMLEVLKPGMRMAEN